MYLGLLQEGEPITPGKIYIEKDFSKITNQIYSGLSNMEDWTMRIKALNTLQGLVIGDGLEYEGFHAFLKSIHELVSQLLYIA